MDLFDKDGKKYEFDTLVDSELARHGWLTPVPPEPKKIDLSVLISSGIDCEFWDKDKESQVYPIGTLLRIEAGTTTRYIDNLGDSYKHCRPRMNGFIHASPTGWDKCPLPEGFTLKIWNRQMDDRPSTSGSQITFWVNVTMFQVTGLQEEWEL